MKQKMCKWCCSKIKNEHFENTLSISTSDCQVCNVCGNKCVSGTFMIDCIIEE